MLKYIKITKPERKDAFKGHANIYNVEILNSFNSELQLKDTESAINRKLTKLLTLLKGFKFVATLVLVFKKIKSKDKRKFDNFYSSSKAKIIQHYCQYSINISVFGYENNEKHSVYASKKNVLKKNLLTYY